jgi:hypothetical protein
MSECAPPCALGQTPARAPKHTPKQAPSEQRYAVHDAAGVVVGTSDVDTEPDTPLNHAAWILGWALESDGVRGRWTLASVLQQVYRRQARHEGLDPMPWKTVATALREFVPVTYKPVRIGGRRRKRLAYLMPATIEDLRRPPPTNVVPLEAVRSA